MKIIVSILCGSERTDWINPALVGWIMKGDCPDGVDAKISLAEDYWPIDFARNACVERALNGSFDWLLMIDNDMRPDDRAFKTIALANTKGLDILGFAYPIVTNFGLRPSVPLGKVEGANDDPDFEEVTAFGSGCMAIRMSVFERLSRPFFKIGICPSEEGSEFGRAIAEDIAFCMTARAKGFRTHIARGIPADHFKTISLLKVYESRSQQPPENGNAIAAAASIEA
jgi:hypothetical protein